MITNIFIIIFTWLLDAIVLILPTWTIYPQEFTDGLQYFFSSMMRFNFFLPIDTFLTAFLFFINFESLYYTAKLVMGGFSMFRGSGDIKV